MQKRTSPFTIQFWLDKGLTEEEATFNSRACRPVMKEYWLKRGHDEEQSILLAKETKANNDTAAAKKNSERTPEERKKTSSWCKEFWIAKGYSLEESKKKVSEAQAHGKLERYIERYGEEGFSKWKQRQINWQNTLKSNPDYESIKMSRNAIVQRKNESIEEFIARMKTTRNIDLFKDIEDYKFHLLKIFEDKPYFRYYPVDKFISTISKSQNKIFENIGIDLKENIKDLFYDEKKFLVVKGNRQAYRRWIREGLLRSSFEIYFYERLTKNKPDIKFNLDGMYPNSNMRYDFLIEGIYIEICPAYETDEKYKAKMIKKQSLFGCVLLKTVEDIDNFIKRL
jgi:hypothetical protein